jgi:hypothetical protein
MPAIAAARGAFIDVTSASELRGMAGVRRVPWALRLGSVAS